MIGGCYDTAKRANKGQPRLTIGGLTKRFMRMCEVYQLFAKDWRSTHSFTDEMRIELFNHESHGLPVSKLNGFALGKSWLNVNVAMWKEDFERGYLFKEELYRDEQFPHWWLDSVLQNLHPVGWSKARFNIISPNEEV